MKNLIKKTSLYFLFLVCSLSAAAQALMPEIPMDPDVRIGKLDNGLTYYIRHNNWPEQRAHFYIAQKVGSILEEDDQRGLAHFLEHMCFNGTRHFPGNSLTHYLETIGVKFGMDLNAYTSVDETVYNINNVPVTVPGAIDSCLYILSDWADGLTLDPKEIDKERGVIHEEWRTRTGAMMRMYENCFPEIFEGSKYAYRLPIGTMEVVDNFKYQTLRDYYEKWYRPDQQGIIVIGDINPDEIEAKIKEIFSPIEMPENPAERVYFGVPDNKEPIITLAKDKEQTNPMICLFYKHDVIPNNQKGRYDYLMYSYAKMLISQMLNMRLYELAQVPNPPYLQAEVSDEDFIVAKTKDAYTCYIASKDNGIENALTAALREIERARRFGFTAAEYDRARANYMSALESSYNERDKTQSNTFAQEYIRHFIDNEPIPSRAQEFEIMQQLAPAINVELLNSLFSGELVSDSNIVISLFLPEKEGFKYPTKESILQVYETTMKEELTPYEDKTSNEPLMAEKPKAGKIVKKENGPFGSTFITLSNGVKVVVKPTDFQSDEIIMRAFSEGGSSLLPDKDIPNILTLNNVIELGGVGNFSALDLHKVLAGKNANVKTYLSATREGISGACSPKDLETMLQLTYLKVTAPRMDKEVFESFKTKQRISLESAEANPMKAFSDSISKAVYNNHPRAQQLTKEMVDQIDNERILEIYKERFADASGFTFLFVGNIDVEKAAPMFEEYLGSLPSLNRNETYKDIQLRQRTGKYENIFVKKMETPKASVYITLHGKCAFNTENSLKMNILTQILDLIYTETVREKEGGTYGVSVGGDVERYPEESAGIEISFETGPEKRAKMTGIILTELEKFAKEGPKESDLNKVKEYMLKSHNENLKKNAYWLGKLENYYWNHISDKEDYVKILNGITAQSIRDFAHDLVKQGNCIQVSMTTEK